MRTKTLLLTAVASAVGVASSLAQVYSVNAVGYVNITVPANNPTSGYALIANPLKGTNNFLNTILPLPDTADGSQIFRFDVGIQNFVQAQFYKSEGADPATWFPDDHEYLPGEGFFMVANNTLGNTLPITFVGEVMQGALQNDFAAGPLFKMMGSQVPQAAKLGDTGKAGTLEFGAEDGDQVFFWDVVNQTYVQTQYYKDPLDPLAVGEWFPLDDNVPVATGFLVQKKSGNTITKWTRTFNVN